MVVTSCKVIRQEYVGRGGEECEDPIFDSSQQKS